MHVLSGRDLVTRLGISLFEERGGCCCLPQPMAVAKPLLEDQPDAAAMGAAA